MQVRGALSNNASPSRRLRQLYNRPLSPGKQAMDPYNSHQEVLILSMQRQIKDLQKDLKFKRKEIQTFKSRESYMRLQHRMADTQQISFSDPSRAGMIMNESNPNKIYQDSEDFSHYEEGYQKSSSLRKKKFGSRKAKLHNKSSSSPTMFDEYKMKVLEDLNQVKEELHKSQQDYEKMKEEKTHILRQMNNFNHVAMIQLFSRGVHVFQKDFVRIICPESEVSVSSLVSGLRKIYTCSNMDELNIMAEFLISEGKGNVNISTLSTSKQVITSFLNELMTTCAQFGEIEYECWKMYFRQNNIRSESENILDHIRGLSSKNDVTSSRIRNSLSEKCEHLDNGRWVEKMIIFGMKFSRSIYQINQKAMRIILRDLEIQVEGASSFDQGSRIQVDNLSPEQFAINQSNSQKTVSLKARTPSHGSPKGGFPKQATWKNSQNSLSNSQFNPMMQATGENLDNILNGRQQEQLKKYLKGKQNRKIIQEFKSLPNENSAGSHQEENDKEKIKENEDLQMNLQRAANIMFMKNITIQELLQDYIFDLVVNNQEISLVCSKVFFRKLEELGIETNKEERKMILAITSQTSSGFLEMKQLEIVFGELGVSEKRPKSTNFLDYEKLSLGSIRLFNRIIKYLGENDFSSLDPLISRIVQVLEIETDNGVVEKVQYIDQKDFCTVIREAKIMQEYDLNDSNEDLLFFLAISPDYSLDKLMLRKLKISIKNVAQNKYCQYMGTELRERPEAGDEDEKSQNPKSKESKMMSFDEVDLSEEEQKRWTKQNTAKAMQVRRQQVAERRRKKKNNTTKQSIFNFQ